MSGPVCVLVGPPGAGKSTVGRILAERLGVAFRDTDADVVAVAGREVSDIFVTDGEAAFRTLERQAVHRALAEHDGVLAVGGGAVLDPRTREALSGRPVVHLTVPLYDATRRVGLGPGRPLLMDNPRARLAQLLDQRRPFYEEVAAAEVATSGRTPDDVAGAVVDALSRIGARA